RIHAQTDPPDPGHAIVGRAGDHPMHDLHVPAFPGIPKDGRGRFRREHVVHAGFPGPLLRGNPLLRHGAGLPSARHRKEGLNPYSAKNPFFASFLIRAARLVPVLALSTVGDRRSKSFGKPERISATANGSSPSNNTGSERRTPRRAPAQDSISCATLAGSACLDQARRVFRIASPARPLCAASCTVRREMRQTDPAPPEVTGSAKPRSSSRKSGAGSSRVTAKSPPTTATGRAELVRVHLSCRP